VALSSTMRADRSRKSTASGTDATAAGASTNAKLAVKWKNGPVGVRASNSSLDSLQADLGRSFIERQG
jgi:hypothetical protein